jgi:hypothetical protein
LKFQGKNQNEDGEVLENDLFKPIGLDTCPFTKIRLSMLAIVLCKHRGLDLGTIYVHHF